MQDCPVYDAERDVATMNVALCARGAARVPRRPRAPKPACYSLGEARAMLRCVHCASDGGRADAALAGVRTAGRRKGALNGHDVRRIVYAAHGNNSASWLACAVGSSLPEWFANLWLPIGDVERHKRELISRVWAALRAVAASGVPVPSDDVAEFVRQCRDRPEGDYFHFAADLPSTTRAKRRDAVLSAACGNVHDALRALGVDAFPCGAARRSLRMHAHPWVPSALLPACVDFVTTGDCIRGEGWLLAQLLATQTEAAVEMAAAHDIPPDDARFYIVTNGDDDGDDAQAMFDTIATILRRRDVAESFAALGMEVVFSGSDEDGIEEVTDTVTGACGNDLDLSCGVEVWSPWRGRWPAEHIATLGPEDMRGCFDRRAALDRALGCRGLELRSDSRVCTEYVLDGTYSGPSFECCGDVGDDLACVVELMAEMEFLFGTGGPRFEESTRALRFAGYARDDASDVAKLAFVHWHTAVEGRPASALPKRLRAIHEGRDAHAVMSAADAWQDAQDAGREMRERRRAEWCEDDDSASDTCKSG